jgi:hypothetical protein
VVWCVGTWPDPLISSLGLPTDHGRLVVDERLAVPGHPGVFTRGYHLLALPAGRLRVATDWIDGRLARPSTVQFGLVPEPRLKP